MYGLNNILSTVSDTLTPPESLTGYGDVYIVTDLRKRGKKEPNEVKSLKSFQWQKNSNAPKLFEPVSRIAPDFKGVYPVFKGNNGIIYFKYDFSDNYNNDFILKDYEINESAKMITLNFSYYKAYSPNNEIVTVWNFSITTQICNIGTYYDSRIIALFGVYEFVNGLIDALKNAQSKLRSNSKDYQTLQYQIKRWQDAWDKYADIEAAPQESAPVESPKAPEPEPTPEPKAQESPKNQNITLINEGDFFAAYGADAVSVADALNLVVTTIGNQKTCQFPKGAINQYLPLLARKGFKVEIKEKPAPAESAPESPAPENEIFNDAETVEIENTPVKNAAEPNWSAIEKDMARAKYWSSFDPEKSAKFETDYYKAIYNEILKDVPADYVDRFNDIFNSKVNELIRLQSKAPNAAVTGGGGVSAAKARKYNAANDRLMESRANFRDYISYIAKRLAAKARRAEFVESTPEQRENAEFERLKPEVEGFIKTKALLEVLKKDPAKYMKDNNIPLPRYYADATDYYNHLLYDYQLGKATFYDKLERVADKGYYNTVSQILDLLSGKGIYTDKHKIFTLIDRAKKWNARKSESFYDKNFSYDGVKIVNNENLDRLQIFFDPIPADDVRTDLKANGFRWSPREKAWQRQYNSNAIIAAKRVLDKHFKKEGLGKPTIKFEFNNNDELKAFLNDNKENLIDSYIDADIADESPLNAKKLALNGMPSADVFNCPESALYCGGLRPTYQRLNDYSHLIDTAENNSVLCGYGFADTTLKTLVNACKYYKQVERLAKHLAAATPLQTAFNIWHWEHTNLRYNYDTPGREEIRTPARTWLDRKSGIDCDCLAVFTAALLLNLGYKPKFEIVAFYNKKEYSHIFVNLDGIAIDRVLPMFNRRPVMICKTLLMEIPVYQLNGLSGDAAINTALHGVYENALKRYTHTLSESDKTDMRKTQILVTLQGCDYNAFRLAGLIMPYVAYIDDAGAYYFNNPDIAKIAANADKQLHDMELRGCSESELNGLFKSIGKAIKKAAQATGKAVASVAKATANTVKAAAQSTVNAVKATGNLVKAGAQAITGHGSDAKETLKKAGEQLKDAIVDPVKQAATDTKNIVVDTVVNPTKTAVQITVDSVKDTVKIAGKVFKVIFVKINPITVLMRNALRMLVAINFLGMASRANVANMTLADAQKQGYSMDAWLDAKTAKGKIVRFFTKMGGKAENIEKAIVNGSKKKPLFKKDYKPESKIVESGEDDATLSGLGIVKCGIDGLGDGGLTIGAALAAVGAFIARIWRWLKNVFTTVAQNETVRNAAGELLETAKDAALERAKSEIQNKINPDGNNKGTGLLVDETTDGTTTDTTTTGNGKKAALIALLVTAGIAATAVAFGGKKKKNKRD